MISKICDMHDSRQVRSLLSPTQLARCSPPPSVSLCNTTPSSSPPLWSYFSCRSARCPLPFPFALDDLSRGISLGNRVATWVEQWCPRARVLLLLSLRGQMDHQRSSGCPCNENGKWGGQIKKIPAKWVLLMWGAQIQKFNRFACLHPVSLSSSGHA